MTVKQFSERMENINDRYLLEAEALMGYTKDSSVARKRRAHLKRILVIAAVLAGLLTLSATAMGGNWFGLRDLLLPQQQEVQLPVNSEVVESDGLPPEQDRQTYQADVISLAGYGGTPESRAVAEWQAFLNIYDQDGAIL